MKLIHLVKDCVTGLFLVKAINTNAFGNCKYCPIHLFVESTEEMLSKHIP